MLVDQPAAGDVVQDAFLGLYRRWDALADRQREAVILRFYLDMPEEQVAATMGVVGLRCVGNGVSSAAVAKPS
jgi:DNA-directed RNA polymerase specialized sigma24 family protein